MFWGITLESGKRYTQVLQRSFQVTMAALGFEQTTLSPVAVMCEMNKAQFVLCSLQAGKVLQQPLKLIFTEGEEVSFFIEGDGEVHLTGFLLPDPQEYEYSDDDEEDEETEEESQESTDDNESDTPMQQADKIIRQLNSKALVKKKKGKIHAEDDASSTSSSDEKPRKRKIENNINEETNKTEKLKKKTEGKEKNITEITNDKLLNGVDNNDKESNKIIPNSNDKKLKNTSKKKKKGKIT